MTTSRPNTDGLSRFKAIMNPFCNCAFPKPTTNTSWREEKRTRKTMASESLFPKFKSFNWQNFGESLVDERIFHRYAPKGGRELAQIEDAHSDLSPTR